MNIKYPKQIQNAKLDEYDLVIVNLQTSRVHTSNTPPRTELHKDCDLLYTDIEKRNSFFNESLKS